MDELQIPAESSDGPMKLLSVLKVGLKRQSKHMSGPDILEIRFIGILMRSMKNASLFSKPSRAAAYHTNRNSPWNRFEEVGLLLRVLRGVILKGGIEHALPSICTNLKFLSQPRPKSVSSPL